jgi:hypothetical protein
LQTSPLLQLITTTEAYVAVHTGILKKDLGKIATFELESLNLSTVTRRPDDHAEKNGKK